MSNLESKSLPDVVWQDLYASLRALAHRVRQRRPTWSLQTSDLLHEVYLRMERQQRLRWEDRQHFLATATLLLRRVWIDQLRRDGRERRQGPYQRSLEAEEEPARSAEASAVDSVDLRRALERLRAEEPESAQILDLRLFGGLGDRAIAAQMGCSVRKVQYGIEFARTWLAERLDLKVERRRRSAPRE